MAEKKATSAEDRKLSVEAELLELDLEERKAESELRQLKLARDIAEAKQEKEQAEQRRILAKLQHDRYVRDEYLTMSNRDSRVLNFEESVTDHTVASAMDQLTDWWYRDDYDGTKRDILIRFKSPGGSVIDGLDLFDFVMDMRANGWKIDTMVTGIAASMAGVLVQMGEERLITKHSTLHLHEVSSLYLGKMSEVADNVKFSEELQRKICTIYAERSGLTYKQVDKLMERKEIFLTAEEALAKGFVDRIL